MCFVCQSGVSNAWLETLLSVIDVLPKDTLRHEVTLPGEAACSLALPSAVAFQFHWGPKRNYIFIGIVKFTMLLKIFSGTMFISVLFVSLEIPDYVLRSLYLLFICESRPSFVRFVADVVTSLLFAF